MGGKVVVVAYLNFVCGYGIVLVTDGENPNPLKFVQCVSGVDEAFAVCQSGMGQQHLDGLGASSECGIVAHCRTLT